jgi:hypothetical protein
MNTMQAFYNRLVFTNETNPYRRLMQARPDDIPTGDLLPWIDW